jgi:hypothetical protein
MAATPLVTITITGAPPIVAFRDPSSAAPEAVDDSPYSFQWTGRHDGGALPAPPERGHYALSLSALAEAKSAMDAHFAAAAEREREAAAAAAAAAAAGAPAEAAPAKKQRAEGGGGGGAS